MWEILVVVIVAAILIHLVNRMGRKLDKLENIVSVINTKPVQSNLEAIREKRSSCVEFSCPHELPLPDTETNQIDSPPPDSYDPSDGLDFDFGPFFSEVDDAIFTDPLFYGEYEYPEIEGDHCETSRNSPEGSD